jgi:hypothetical protein
MKHDKTPPEKAFPDNPEERQTSEQSQKPPEQRRPKREESVVATSFSFAVVGG